jgi:hypothetical protein
MVVTGVADRMPERIKHLVYLDAFVPADGQSLSDLAGGGPTPALDDWRVLPRARTEGTDLPDAEWNSARRGPQGRACFEERIHLSAPLESRPFTLTYVLATERLDPGEPFDRTAAELRSNPRWTVRELPGGHNLQRTNPDGVVNLLLEIAERQPSVAR